MSRSSFACAASCHVQCSLPGLNREQPRPVFPARPFPIQGNQSTNKQSDEMPFECFNPLLRLYHQTHPYHQKILYGGGGGVCLHPKPRERFAPRSTTPCHSSFIQTLITTQQPTPTPVFFFLFYRLKRGRGPFWVELLVEGFFPEFPGKSIISLTSQCSYFVLPVRL